jgi:hypothetical protein
MTVKEGWRGRFFEDFKVGDVYEHPLGRTVTTTDNMWFTLLTQNTAPIHVDHAYAAKTEFGRPLVDSTFTVALMTGQSVTDVSQNVFANLPLAPRRWHRDGTDYGLQPGWQDGHHLPADRHDLQAGPRAQGLPSRPRVVGTSEGRPWRSSCEIISLRSERLGSVWESVGMVRRRGAESV